MNLRYRTKESGTTLNFKLSMSPKLFQLQRTSRTLFQPRAELSIYIGAHSLDKCRTNFIIKK